MEYSIHCVEEHSGDVLGQVALARGVPHPFPPVMDIPAPSRLHLKKTHPNNTPLVTLWAGFIGGRGRAVDPLHIPACGGHNPYSVIIFHVCFGRVGQRFYISVYTYYPSDLSLLVCDTSLVGGYQLCTSIFRGHGLPWQYRQYVPPKSCYPPTRLHGVTNQNTPSLNSHHTQELKIMLYAIVFAV
jgi:hypothetical protein